MKFKIIDLCELFIDHKYIVFLVFGFQAEFAQNKNNMDLTSYQFMTKTIRFFGGGEERGEKNAPYLYPALHQTVTCFGMLTSELGNVTETVT